MSKTKELRLWVAVFALIGLFIAGSAYCQLFTTFRFWDDEGYVLISLRNFASGGRLYTEVFSQYGPTYNLFYAALHKVGMPLNTESARYLTLAAWLLTVGLGALVVGQVSGSRLWAAIAALAVFAHLYHLTDEPLHPVGMISVLLTAGLAGGTGALIAGRPGWAGAATATTGVLLALIKINVGLFYLAGLGTFVLWSTRGWWTAAPAKAVLAGLAALSGAVLMRPLWSEPWVRLFAVVYAATAIMTLATLARECVPAWRVRNALGPALAAAIAAAAAVLACSLSAGIGPAQLYQGIVRGPLRQPTSFFLSFRWSRLTLEVLGGNLAAFALYTFWRGQRAKAKTLVAAARVIVAAGYFISFYHGFAVTLEGYMLSFGSSFLWAFAAPLVWREDSHPGRHRARLLLSAVALFQLLHAFPVAGTQVSLATLPLLLLLLVSLAEVGVWAHSVRLPAFLSGLARMSSIAAIALAAWGCGRLTWDAGRAYLRQPAESFTGAGLRLPPWQSSTFDNLLANSRWNGDMLFSMPGMFSLNLWTGLPTPNRLNITQWWSLLTETQQSSIAARLDKASHPVVIIQRNIITTGFAKAAFKPSLLTRYIESHFSPLYSLDSYEFWVRNDVSATALGVAHWAPYGQAAAFSFFRPDAAATPVTKLELLGYEDDAPAALTLGPGAFTVSRAPGPIGSGVELWTVKWPGPRPNAVGAYDSARLLAPDGSLIAEARFERPKPQRNPY